MTLDAMHVVLYAIYAEYQKDLPDMTAITAEALGLDKTVFFVALAKLQNEGIISGANLVYVDQLAYPLAATTGRVMPTSRGLELASGELEISERTGVERARHLAQKFAVYGWNALTDFAAKVLVEISKQSIK